MKILLVEDDLVDQMAFSRWLSKELQPCELTVANGVQEVAQLAEQKEFEVIVCDYLLPDGTVLDVAKLFDPQLIICISGLSDPQKIEALQTASIPNFLFKDTQLVYLQEFKQLLSQKYPMYFSPTSTSSSPEEKRLINLDHLREAFDHKPEPIRDIIQIFLRQTPQQLTALQAALEAQDEAQCHAIAHRLKSSYRMMGLIDQMKVLQNIEDGSSQIANNPRPFLDLFQQLHRDSQMAYTQLSKELDQA